MSSHQYCLCGVGLNPTNYEIIDTVIICPSCGEENKIVYLDQLQDELLKKLVDLLEDE